MNLAIESGNENVLNHMNKKLSLEKVTEVVQYCSKEKIHTVGFMLIGYPGETKESFKKTLTFYRNLLRLGLSSIAPFIVNPYPGTKLYKSCIDNKYLTKPINPDHFFSVSNTDDILITTDKFNKDDVALWLELANNIQKPYLAYFKKILKKYTTKPLRRKIKSFLKSISNKL